ncbi:MAG: sigma-70 family RNA polymerase sigma factor, partial [Solirubrobacteraceae bacterium]
NYYPLSLDDRQQRAGDDVSTIADQLGWADPGFSKVETRDALRQAVNKLPATERQVVYLRFYEGLTQREIAEKVGVSQMHVSRLLSRALDQLRALASVWA